MITLCEAEKWCYLVDLKIRQGSHLDSVLGYHQAELARHDAL